MVPKGGRFLKSTHAGTNVDGWIHTIGNSFLCLQPISGDVRHNDLIAVQSPRLCKLLEDANSYPASRFSEDTFGPRQELDALDDLVVVNHLGIAACVLHDSERVVAVGRIANRQRLGDRA